MLYPHPAWPLYHKQRLSLGQGRPKIVAPNDFKPTVRGAMSSDATNYSSHTSVSRSLSVPASMDRGLPVSKFPPVLVMYHPSMEALAKSLVKSVNEKNQLFEDGEVTKISLPLHVYVLHH